MIAVLALCLVACGKDEPTLPMEPERPENPTDPGSTEDPKDSNQDDPGNQGNTDGNPEFWEDENPHGFFFDVDSLQLHLNQDGFLQFRGRNPSDLNDEIVIDKRFHYYEDSNACKQDAKYYGGYFRYPMHVSHMRVAGKRATPWNNVNRYKEMFTKVHIRPESQFSNFPELADFPLGNVQAFGIFVWDTLVYAEVITHKYFNSKIPAESLMPGDDDGSDHPVYVSLGIVHGSEIFSIMQKGPWRPGGVGPEWIVPLGNITQHNTLPKSWIQLMIAGYPEKAGDYPMTLTLKFASGRVLTRDFKVRFVNKE